MSTAQTAVIEQAQDATATKRKKPVNGTARATDRVASEIAALGPLPRELWPNIDHLITEDDTPVDNFYSEKQQRLGPAILHATPDPFGPGRSFIATANVGLYSSPDEPPQVPDIMVSLDVSLPDDIWEKGNRCYLIWQFGKPPELVIEIVSNKTGGEASTRKDKYARMRVAYYVIYDPAQQLSKQVLRVYELRGTSYVLRKDHKLPDLGLELILWQGKFEDWEDTWLRWCDRDGNLLLTASERAEQEHQRAEQEHQRAEQATQAAEAERQMREASQRQVELLLAQLRALGAEPNLTLPSQ